MEIKKKNIINFILTIMSNELKNVITTTDEIEIKLGNNLISYVNVMSLNHQEN